MGKQYFFKSNVELDLEFIFRIKKFLSLIAKIFRFEKLERGYIDTNVQNVFICNHGVALWGVLDVFVLMDLWYNKLEAKQPIYMISEEFVFGIPIVGRVAFKLGLRPADSISLKNIVDSGMSLAIPAGGNFDLGKPLVLKDYSILKRISKNNGVAHFQTWFLKSLKDRDVSLKPLVISGTSEMTPILYVSPKMFKMLGFGWLRKQQVAYGYPITLNHFINIMLFIVIFPNATLFFWFIFLLANIYFDIIFTYPVFLRKICVSAGGEMRYGDHASESFRDDKNIMPLKNKEIVEKLMLEMHELLSSIEKGRKDVFHCLWVYINEGDNSLAKIVRSYKKSYLQKFQIDMDDYEK